MRREPIYAEAQVPSYALPEILIGADGTPVRDPAGWARRRDELLALFQSQVYGAAPPAMPALFFRTLNVDTQALDGRATRKEIEIVWGADATLPPATVLLYLPNDRPRPVPVFLGLNFRGNLSVHRDPDIRMTTAWMADWKDGATVNARATEATRGLQADRWQVERILARGYGLVTAYYGDFDPDFDDGFQNGVHALGPALGIADVPEPERWGAIAAWAWGLSRIMDYLETDGDVDARRVALMGHSRLGKTALWAGALDPRFALVISNNSGCGGAALSRRCFGETVALINHAFPHWFCGHFKRYNDREADLPIDQHQLLALIAPRPLYVASASEDRWADPRGEFLAFQAAFPVYRLLTGEGLPPGDMPPAEGALTGRMAYHLRRGTHGVTEWDWNRYLDFADRWLGQDR